MGVAVAVLIIVLIMVFDTALVLLMARWLMLHKDDWGPGHVHVPDYVPPEWVDEHDRRSPPV